METETSTAEGPHHDALVVQITIANLDVRRVLIDNESSANVLFLSTLKEMQLDESKIKKKTVALVGFSVEVKVTLGEVDLPVYAEGMNMNTTFPIINADSAYNVILGRPWIHEMRGVPSTYYQLMKFPTPWGVRSIKEEQRQARECYMNSLKFNPKRL